jgi:hypothetical protein
VRLRAAAEVTVAALANGELRQAALFFLPFDPRQLRADQRPMNRAFFDLPLFAGRLLGRLVGRGALRLFRLRRRRRDLGRRLDDGRGRRLSD